jgi:competence protein ComEA
MNSATLDQLQQLPGVGPSTAQAIVSFREKSGPFKRAGRFAVLPGISKIKFEKLRPCVTPKTTCKARFLSPGGPRIKMLDDLFLLC